MHYMISQKFMIEQNLPVRIFWSFVIILNISQSLVFCILFSLSVFQRYLKNINCHLPYITLFYIKYANLRDKFNAM